MKKAIALFTALCISACVFAQSREGGDAPADTEPYLSLEDQEALLDKAADAIIEAAVTAQHKADAAPETSFVVRIEVYSRIKGKKVTEYISVGDLSLEPGFFSWTHDGSKRNGYAVYMYPASRDKSRIKPPNGVRLLYGKSFRSAEEAAAEIQTRGSGFNRLIRYKPVIDQMIARLNGAPYQGGSK